MSTSPETSVVNLLSRWLAGHAGNEEVRAALEQVDTSALGAESGELVADLRAELAQARPGGQLERLVRETIEAVAFGA